MNIRYYHKYMHIFCRLLCLETEKDMRQGFREQGQSPMRQRRTQPALVGATAPTVPTFAQESAQTAGPYEPERPGKQAARQARHALWLLALPGIGSIILWLALAPLLSLITPAGDPAKTALLRAFSWLPRLYWTNALPGIVQLLARALFFQVTTTAGAAHLLLVLLGLSYIAALIAGRTGSNVMRSRLTAGNMRGLLALILLFAALAGCILLIVPGIMPQDMFLYGIYGRLVTVYHVNPYTAALALFKDDPVQQALTGSVPNTLSGAAPGPVWMDICIIASLLAGASAANVIIIFRLLGLLAHLANTGLIWLILAKHKPESRASAAILYAWNPLVLLLAVNGMHLDVFLILFFLLAIFTMQRRSFMLGWIFLILAALINLLALLVLPLFLRVLAREVQGKRADYKFLWWSGITALSVVVVALAYLPYWQGWGIDGILANARQTFLQDSAVNSLNAVLQRLPVHLPGAFAWLAAPHHWTLLAAIAVACILLFGAWLTDSVRMAIAFSSWIMLALLALLPQYWPWYALLPLTLALCSASRRAITLAQLLALGALASLYALLWQPVWSGLALLTIGLPVLIWGWALFFTATWDMLHANTGSAPANAAQRPGRRGFSWPSRPPRGMK